MNRLVPRLMAAAAIAATAAAHADTLTSTRILSDVYTVETADGQNIISTAPFSVTDLTTAQSFIAFCLEPNQAVSSALMGAGDSSYTASIYNNAAVTALYDGYYANATGTARESAAFQYALWEIVSDSGNSVTTGSFALNSSDAAVIRAQQMLDGVGAGTGSYSLTAWASPSSQDLLQATPTTPVPEPESYAMMLAGLGIVGLVLRRGKPPARG